MVPIEVQCLPVGSFQANCYVVSAGAPGPCLLIDPGGDPERILEVCREQGLTPTAIALTHGHVDHMGGAEAIRRETGAPVFVHAEDREIVATPHPYFAQMVGGVEACVPDGELTEGQGIGVEGARLTVWHTPGHSPGCVCLVGEGIIFTGDTLFAGNVGRTDLPGGSMAVLTCSLQRIAEETSPDMAVCPGHGETSTIADELATNPWLSKQ